MGALVDKVQMDTVLRYIESGKSEGAKVLAGGEQTKRETGGFYVQPTIFDEVRNDMTIAREEIFGPVLSVLSFTDTADVVRQANQTIYGLQAGVWTRDLNKAHGVARALRAGTVHVNQYDEDDITIHLADSNKAALAETNLCMPLTSTQKPRRHGSASIVQRGPLLDEITGIKTRIQRRHHECSYETRYTGVEC